MIPGSNKLILCPAALMEAVQEYLDKRTTAKIAKVTDVKYASNGISGGSFVVELEDSSSGD
jgi:hypothetical protein